MTDPGYLFSRRLCLRLIASLCLLILGGCSSDDRSRVSGILEWDRVELIAETNEQIINIAAAEGDALDADAVILEQDSRRIQAQLDEAIASQQQASARLAEMVRGPRRENIEQARALLRGAESTAEYAQRELERGTALLEQKLISKEQVDSLRTLLAKARADRDSAKAALEALLNGTTAEELQQAEAAVAQADARERNLRVTLEHLTLKAPRSGILDNLPYEAGERPAAGAVIAVMLIGERPFARVYVPEPIRASVQQGDHARVHVDGIEKAFEGRVRMISSDAAFTPFYSLTERDRSRLSYVAEVELTNPPSPPLPSGVPVDVEFELSR